MFNKLLKKNLSKSTNKYMTKDINDWTVQDVSDWLNANGLSEITIFFEKNAISGIVLKNITDYDLVRMGINKIGHRKKILAIITEFTGDPNINPREIDLISESTLTSSYDNSTIQLKIEYNGIIKRLKLPKGSKFEELQNELKNKFDINNKPIIEFMDRDKDKISINNEEDWCDYLQECDKSIKLYITTLSSSSSSVNSSISSSITNLKKSNSPIKRKHYSFKIFDRFTQGIIITNSKGIIQYINPVSEKILNYTTKELSKKSIKVIIPEDNNYPNNYFVMENGSLIEKEGDIIAVTHEGTYINIHIQFTENYANKKRLFIGIITEPKKKMLTLLHMAREILCNLVNPSITITEIGIIQIFNKSAQDFWGYSMEEVIGKHFRMLMSPEYTDNQGRYIQPYLTGKNGIAMLKDGNVRNIYLTISEKKDDDKSIYIGIVTLL